MNLSSQEKIAIIVLLILIIIGLGSLLYRNYYFKETLEVVPYTEDRDRNEPKIVEKIPMIVHIVGAIKNPGVYQLEEKDRVINAIEIAGGATEEANLDAINLAAFIHDGQKIIVPFIISQDPDKQDKNIVFAPNESPYSANSFNSSNKININIVNTNALQSLPGIGPVLSEKIITYRNQNGSFETIDDIKEVSGIGEKKFEGIKDLICVY